MINLDFATLASPSCQIFCEICKFKYRGLFFQEPTLGHFLKYQFNYFHYILYLYAPVIVMTLAVGDRDRPGSFVKEYLMDQRQFVILRFPSGGKIAIMAILDILVLFIQKRGRGAQIFKRNERGNIRTALQIPQVTKQ